MTESLITRVSFIPKASDVSDFDMVTVATLSEHLKGIISPICGCKTPAGLGGHCNRKECKKEYDKFKQSIDQLIQSSVVLPENFVTHVRSQAEK